MYQLVFDWMYKVFKELIVYCRLNILKDCSIKYNWRFYMVLNVMIIVNDDTFCTYKFCMPHKRSVNLLLWLFCCFHNWNQLLHVSTLCLSTFKISRNLKGYKKEKTHTKQVYYIINPIWSDKLLLSQRGVCWQKEAELEYFTVIYNMDEFF